MTEIKFKVQEQIGVPVFWFEPEIHGDPIDSSKLRPVTNRVSVGDKILVPSLLGYGYHLMTIQPDMTAKSGKLTALLKFDPGLLCIGLVNIDAVKKLELNS